MASQSAIFQHRFDSPEGYLHHRPPYLLIEDIAEIKEAALTATATVREDAFFIQGHFPGAPVLPGAMMQEMTTQAAGALIAANYNPMQEYKTDPPDFNEFALGVLVRIKNARYRGFARPGAKLDIVVELQEKVGDLFDFGGEIREEGTCLYKNRFQLTNLRSDELRA